MKHSFCNGTRVNMADRFSIIALGVLIIQGLSIATGQVATHASETSLRATLASGYDQKTRPYTPTYVDLAYFLRSIQDLSVAEQELHHTALLVFMWHDPRLAWTPSSYSNITELDINWTWRPMFAIGNSVDSADMLGSDDDVARVTVYYNGSVVWPRVLITASACDVDITNFPYDDQQCDIYLAFFGNDYGNNFMFNLSSTEVNTGFYIPNAEWKLQGSSVKILTAPLCCPLSTLSWVSVTFKFDRMHTFYVNTFLIPTILLSICMILPFYLPSESGERLGFSLTILLSYTVVLTLTADFLPTTSKEVPTIAAYLLTVLVLCSISLCNVTINVKLYHLTTSPPDCLKRFYRKSRPIVFLEFCSRRKRKTGKVSSEVVVVDMDQEKPPLDDAMEISKLPEPVSSHDEEEVTWAMVSEVFDRICFVVYLLIVFILNVTLMSHLAQA